MPQGRLSLVRSAAVVLLLVALAPALAAAAPAEGDLLLAGPALLDGPAEVAAANAAAFLNGTERVTHFQLNASRVAVGRYHETFLDVPLAVTTAGVFLRSTEATYQLTDVGMSLGRGDHAGWIGIYDAPELRFDTVSIRVNASSMTTIGNTPTAETSPTPRVHTFGLSRSALHDYATFDGGVAIRGDFVLKVSGLDLDVRASENVSTLRTGTARDPSTSQRAEDWVFIRAEEAELVLRGTPEIEAVADIVRASWSGTLDAPSASGRVRTETAIFTPRGGEMSVAGNWSAAFTPSANRAGPVMQVALTGELDRAERMDAQALRVASGPRVGAWWWGGVGVVVLGVAIATIASRARERRELGADELVELGRLASEAGRHAEAVDWFERAHAAAPKSSMILGELAFNLGESGRVDEALARYAEASDLSGTGEADLDAVRLLERLGSADGAMVERLLARALSRSPELYVEALELDAASSPRVHALVEDAMRRAERDR